MCTDNHSWEDTYSQTAVAVALPVCKKGDFSLLYVVNNLVFVWPSPSSASQVIDINSFRSMCVSQCIDLFAIKDLMHTRSATGW